MPYIFSEVAKVIPQLKTLSILTCVDRVANIPASPTAFSNVKRLELFFVQDWQYDLVKIIAPLLRALPVLQKLYVVMPYPEFSERRVDELPGYLHSELKEVEICGFCGTWNQIEFATYLLENAVALERMVLMRISTYTLRTEFWTDVHTHQGLWSKEKREFICDQLLGKNFSGKTQVIIR
ncbi:uncharacterized protein LOC132304081 isoform X2 [Cornus florida]|uniref:uncharacterized protein LOC132304081 isoform X2 n=1 Tax=Cornus florida TaxID=4283 RepID=UPI0028A195F3|nr:uncharacterized protein LOC132304081 isoform X2 [Cornus florida]